jgi:hypothetical protein
MTWLLWRQHRAPIAIGTLLLVAFAVPGLVTGTHLADSLAACRANGSCGRVDLLDGYRAINIIVDLTIMVPLLIGLFWGATIAGRELETDTATLVWTQSVTRRTWIASKLLMLFGYATLTSAAVTGLVTWWSQAHNATVESRFSGLQFDIQGVVPVAYTLFAAALGLCAGALWRRMLPAMATTVGGFIGVRLLVELAIRPHYMAPIVRDVSMAEPTGLASGSLGISSQLVQHGHVVMGGAVAPPVQCASAVGRDAMGSCMDALGYRLRVTYQPASRYWPFQWIEAAVFVGLAVALTVVAVLALRRRDP